MNIDIVYIVYHISFRIPLGAYNKNTIWLIYLIIDISYSFYNNIFFLINRDIIKTDVVLRNNGLSMLIV